MISPRIHHFLAQRINRMGFGDLTWFNDDAHHGGDVDRRASCKLSDTVTITAAAYEAHNPGHDPGAVEFVVQQFIRGDAMHHNAATVASETLVADEHLTHGQKHDNETARAMVKEIDGAIARRQMHLDGLREARALLADALPDHSFHGHHPNNNDCNATAPAAPNTTAATPTAEADDPTTELHRLAIRAFELMREPMVIKAENPTTDDVVLLMRVPSDQAERIGRVLNNPVLVTVPTLNTSTESATHARHMAAKAKTQAPPPVQPNPADHAAPTQTHAAAAEEANRPLR